MQRCTVSPVSRTTLSRRVARVHVSPLRDRLRTQFEELNPSAVPALLKFFQSACISPDHHEAVRGALMELQFLGYSASEDLVRPGRESPGSRARDLNLYLVGDFFASAS